MKTSSNKIDRKTLKLLEPLNRLNPILLDELAEKSIVEEVPAGRIICRHGEKDSRQIYLMSGQIEVVTPGETGVKVLKSKSPLTKAIAEGSPRTATLKTKTISILLYIDADLLELLMSDEPELGNSAATYEVTEITAEDSDDWMLTFLQSPAFLKLPTENIQKLLVQMDEVNAQKGQVVITQGAKDDNYYIIKSGSCNVHRKPYENAANVLLAVLPTGSGFGEESLISNGTRNATITMREDGTLMRLKKKDFLELLIEPLITFFEHSETQQKINAGCVVIDVRAQEQAKLQPIEGAVNIPLSMLRVKFDSLNNDREYLLICDDSSQSSAAAFLMIQHGLKCSVLRNGIKGGATQPKVENKSDTPITTNTAIPENKPSASAVAQQQLAEARKQSEKIAAQQKLIKEASLKAEQDIIKHKQELAESRARLANKSNQIKASQEEAAKLKQKAELELAKAQAEAQANTQRQKEAEQARVKAEAMLKKSIAEAELSRKNAEEEAAAIKQRALEEVEYLRAEVEAARLKMEADSARIKQEEQIIKQSALQIKQQADEIRREAMLDAEQVRQEVEATRALLTEKLRNVEEEEKRKHNAILADAKKRADEIAASQTEQAAKEAEAIRQKAKEDAIRLHAELEATRKQIEAEAARAIESLKEQSKQAPVKEAFTFFDDEEDEEIEAIPVLQVAEKPKEVEVDYSAVSIPGLPSIESVDFATAKRKAETIKAKLTQARLNDSEISNTGKISDNAVSEVKIHKTNDKIILEGNEDVFIFKGPDGNINRPQNKVPANSSDDARNSVDKLGFTKIPQGESFNIVIKQQEVLDKTNPFLNADISKTTKKGNINHVNGNAPDFVVSKKSQQFNQQAYKNRHKAQKSNVFAIAASVIMIIAGAVFTLHATDTLKVQSIAKLFDSGNDTVIQPATAIAKTKTIRPTVLRADTNVDAKKKVENKMDDIMQGWKDVLSDSKTPKKLQNSK